ncbi:hypothetical protein NDR87_21110 [Nocardia sp. CDC159]|uniref:Uncharacterized protein n=1 Tax=Nocardia pulmonis TaxID=2951408 RepID=A0A9X2E968_9NOCA|nr:MULTISPECIES: hypothetical protein [Nocardia]MCM6776447.1 hypothetical protein [Nocardia pulmonis]MCM6788871.1 hypothetical protein [Nocardia sp. CDC159]
MARLQGLTEKNGWKKEVHARTSLGPRYHDIALPKSRQAKEYKTGRVGPEALRQLEKDRYLMARGWVISWVLAPNVVLDPRVQAEMDRLRARYPKAFQIERVTHEQFRQAIALGKQIAKERAQRERDDELAKTLDQTKRKELEEKKRQLAKDVAEQNRRIAEARQGNQALELQALKEAQARMSKTLEEIRTQERAQAQATLNALGLSKAQAEEMAKTLEANREAQRKDVVKGLEAFGHVVQSEERARAEEQKVREERARAMEQAERTRQEQQRAFAARGMSELAQHLDLMRGVAPPGVTLPGMAPAPEAVRGRAAELARQRERGMNRER